MIFFILISCKNEKKNKDQETAIIDNKPMKGYKERINDTFDLYFQYPNHLIISRIDNGICISDVFLEPETYNEKKVSMCLWMQSQLDNTIESLISERKSKEPKNVIESRESCKWKNIDITVVLLKNENKISQKLIYFTKFDALFEVIIIKDFETMNTIFESIIIK